MKKIFFIILLIITGSLLYIGCSTKPDNNVEIVKGELIKEELPSYIRLGEYKGFTVEKDEKVQITESDIKEQIDYALNKAGETTLTVENVKSVSGYSLVEEYKNAIRENLEKLNKSAQNNDLMNKAWDSALEQATLIKCPQEMLNIALMELKSSYQNYTQLMNITYDEVLKQLDLTDADIEAKATNYVKSDIMVYAIAEAENITVSDEAYKDEVEIRMKYYDVNTEKDLVDLLGSDADLHFTVLADKVMEFVYENARIIESSN